jgi:hypothetical protein
VRSHSTEHRAKRLERINRMNMISENKDPVNPEILSRNCRLACSLRYPGKGAKRSVAKGAGVG